MFRTGDLWFYGAICPAMRASGELLGGIEGSSAGNMGVQECLKNILKIVLRICMSYRVL